MGRPPSLVTIVIVSLNTVREVVACIDSIERCAAAGPHEIVVVDNASTDGSVEAVRTRFPSVSSRLKPRLGAAGKPA